MLRKLIFAVSVLALTLTSCGRQVTPNRNSGSSGQFGLPAGYMQIKFNTAGQLDFANNWYVLAFNTSGTGGEPYAIYGNQAQNWTNWSAEILVYQLQSSSQPVAVMWQFITQQGTGSLKAPYQVRVTTPQQLQLNPNCNGLGTQFCVTVDRHIFIPPTATPTAATWYVNWFVASPQTSVSAPNSGTVVSAPGPLGINDSSVFQYTVDTTLVTDVAPWTRQSAWPAGPTDSATIAGGEILNNP